MKRFFIIIAGLILVLLLAFVFYFVRNRGKSETPAQEQKVEETLPSPQLVVSEPVISPILSFSGENIWFVNNNGQMFRTGLDGQEREEYLLPQTLENATRILWQKNNSNFIVERNLDGHIRHQYFDAEGRAFVEYPPPMRQIAFLPDERRIVYIWVRGNGGHELKIADTSGENFQKITDLFRTDYQLAASPTRDEVILFTSSNDDPSKLFLVDLEDGAFRDLDEQGLYQGVKFSPDGSKVLAKKNGEWMVYDLANISPPLNVRGGGEELSEIIWASDRELIFAASTGISKYHLDTGEETVLYKFKEQDNFVPTNLLLHPQSPILFFVDEQTGYLYRLEL